MASNPLRIHQPSLKTLPCQSFRHPPRAASSLSLPYTLHHARHGLFSVSTYLSGNHVGSFSVRSSLSFGTPPASREEAIRQAKTCLVNALTKHISKPKLAGTLKKIRQPRFQVEIPLTDDSQTSLTQLALDVFRGLTLPISGTPVKTLILWPSEELSVTAAEVFKSNDPECSVDHGYVGSITKRENEGSLRAADVAIFFAAEGSDLGAIKEVCDRIVLKPVVMFNPNWEFGEETDLGKFKVFAESFEVIYAFAGLAVQGILKTRKGMLFSCADGGARSGEKWAVLVEEEGKMKVVSKFKTRPSINEVSDVLYNVMALNSPITKSAKFLKQFVSNFTGKK